MQDANRLKNFSIIFYRVLFHHPLAEKLMPTLFILYFSTKFHHSMRSW